MSIQNDGGSEFPVNAANLGGSGAYSPDPGRSLRDYFVAKAMQGDLAAQSDEFWFITAENIRESVERWYRIANAMLAERNKS